MRKVVIARSKEMSADEALAYNMKQTATRMPKEKIAARMAAIQERMKKRQERMKVLGVKQKKTQNPDAKIRYAQMINRHTEKLAKQKEALKYYKRLASLKPVEPKAKRTPKKATPPQHKRPSWPTSPKKNYKDEQR